MRKVRDIGGWGLKLTCQKFLTNIKKDGWPIFKILNGEGDLESSSPITTPAIFRFLRGLVFRYMNSIYSSSNLHSSIFSSFINKNSRWMSVTQYVFIDQGQSCLSVQNFNCGMCIPSDNISLFRPFDLDLGWFLCCTGNIVFYKHVFLTLFYVSLPFQELFPACKKLYNHIVRVG